MSKIIAVQVGKGEKKEKSSHYFLGSYSILYRSTMRDIISVAFNEIAKELKVSEIESVKYYADKRLENNYLVIYQNKNVNAMCVTTEKIPQTLITKFFVKLVSCSNKMDESQCIADFEASKFVDKVDIIEKQLEDTKNVLVESIDLIIARGQSLDALLIKSEELKDSSKIFLRRTQRLNRCCVIL